jgi:high-affinity iron transporter
VLGKPNIRAMGASFLITLREGLEIALVLAIATAYLVKSGRRTELRSVYAGSSLAALICVIAGVVVHVFTSELHGKVEQATEATLALASCAVLTWMIFWMRSNARSMGGELRAKVDAATTTKALTVLAFVAVAREGFETVLFLLSAETQNSSGAEVVVGGLLGLAVAAVLGWLIYVGGRRINLGTFFKITGVLMIMFAAGLAGKAAHELTEFTGLGPNWLSDPMWNFASGSLAAGTFHDFIEGLFGWSANPERIRVAVYAAYLIPVLWLYLRRDSPSATHADAVHVEQMV